MWKSVRHQFSRRSWSHRGAWPQGSLRLAAITHYHAFCQRLTQRRRQGCTGHCTPGATDNPAECGLTRQQILIHSAALVRHGYPPDRPTENSSCAAVRYAARHWTGEGTCALRKGADGSVTSHCGVTHTTLTVTSTGEREQDHTGRSCVRCKGSSNRRGDTRTRSATSLSSTTGAYRRAEQSGSCAVPSFDTVAWFPGVLQRQWIDVSVRCPNAERYHASAT